MASRRFRRTRAYLFTASLLLLPLLAWAVISMTRVESGRLEDAASGFLDLLRQGRVRHAHDAASSEFQDSTTDAALRSFVQLTYPGGIRDWIWKRERHVPGGRLLQGQVWSNEGSAIDTYVTLKRVGSLWKVVAIEVPQRGIISADSKSGIPGDREVRTLVDSALALVAQCQSTRDFSALHRSLARPWQLQTTPGLLATQFRPLQEQQVNLTSLAGLAPVITRPPTIDSNHLLHVAGYYTPPTGRISFSMGFAYEHPEWRLHSLDLSNP
jgi:hypothetical protein